jgi:hypothetical protein
VNEVTTRSLVVACVFNDGQVVWSVGVVVDASVTDGFCRVLSSCYADIWCWMYLVVMRIFGARCILLFVSVTLYCWYCVTRVQVDVRWMTD